MKRPWTNWYVFKALLTVCNKNAAGAAILTRAYAHAQGWGCEGPSSVEAFEYMQACQPASRSIS